MKTNGRVLFCVLGLLLSETASIAQEGRTETLHVKKVESRDESDKNGSWTHITATVEDKTVQFEIKCDEWHGIDGSVRQCVHIEAGRDYSAKVFPTAIDFGAKPHGLVYSIESETEK
jgi:predicted phage tail protein